MRISDWSSDVCSSDLSSSARPCCPVPRSVLVLQPNSEQLEVMVDQLEAEIERDPLLQILEFLVVELDHLAALDVDHVVVVVLRPRLALIARPPVPERSEEHTSELQSLMRISYAVFCLKKK